MKFISYFIKNIETHLYKLFVGFKFSKRMLSKYLDSTLALGLTYILMIPTFALIYAFVMPTDFYHANLKLEDTYYDDLSRHRENIRSLFQKYLFEIKLNGEFEFKEVGALQYYEEGYFTVPIFIDKKDTKCPKAPEILYQYLQNELCQNQKVFFCEIKDYAQFTNNYNNLFGYNMNCSGMKNVDTHHPIDYFRHYFKKEADLKVASTIPDTYLLTYLNAKTFFETDSDNYKKQLVFDLAAYEASTKGKQIKPSLNVFIRMMYFSVVTITTLGYGDISPVSNRARICVGLESFLGIVIIGLFLNSMATKIRKAEQT